jgi:hypothetical protein
VYYQVDLGSNAVNSNWQTPQPCGNSLYRPFDFWFGAVFHPWSPKRTLCLKKGIKVVCTIVSYVFILQIMDFDPTDIAYIQIFPPIGIARLGDSGFDLSKGTPDGEIKWFLPSEIPGTEDMPAGLQGQFRDANNRIKRQARLLFSLTKSFGKH